MAQRFDGKVALITGGARGFGLATAQIIAREGGTVVITDIDEPELSKAVETSVAEGLKIEGKVQDVTDAALWTTIVSDVVARHGHLDILVNNAGIGAFYSVEDTTQEHFQKIMQVNLESVFLGVKAGIAAMKERGGAIVNVASIAGNIAEPMLSAYCASKGGVRMLTKVAAVDCARRGYPIRINSVHPGYAGTKLVNDAVAALGEAGGPFVEAAMKMIPIGRLADPTEIAKPIAFLASDDASYMLGSELIVDGGYTAA